MRIQKYLAAQNVASRRQIEVWIEQGLILVNKKKAKLGDRVQDGDVIAYATRSWLVAIAKPKIEILSYYKPLGEICSKRDTHARATVFEAINPPKQGRWIQVGRLDINSEGLLLFCNDGEYANKMMHPSANWLRRYKVRVFGTHNKQTLEACLKGVVLDGQLCRFESIKPIGQHTGLNNWFEVAVYTGKYRMVRRICESVGMKVNRLIRIGYGPVSLVVGSKPGHIHLATEKEIASILKAL